MTSDKAVEYFLNKDNKLPFVPDRAMEEKATDLLIQVQQGINYDNGETDSDFLAPPTLDYSARVFRRTLEHVPREDWDFALENFHESFVAHPQPVLNILGASGVSVTNEQLDAIFRDPED